MHSRDLYFLGQRGMTCKLDMMKSSHFLIRRWLIKQGNKSQPQSSPPTHSLSTV